MQFLGRRAVRRGLAGGLGAVLVLAAAASATAQVSRRDVPIVAQPQQRFNSGQDIQPIFEGWTRNEDGSYQFHYGYLNRNYRERPNVPVGEDNFFSPGEPDRGQPTYFYPRTNRYQFDVHVPADFPLDAELIWEVTRQGSTQRAYGWLQPEWEIDVNTITSNARTQFGRGVDQLYTNIHPEVSVEASHDAVAVGTPVTLTARVTDDDLPTPVAERDDSVPRRRRDPTLVPPPGAPQIPDNIPSYTRPSPDPEPHLGAVGGVSRAGRRRVRALRLPGVGRGDGRRRLDVGHVRDHRHLRRARRLHAARLRQRRHADLARRARDHGDRGRAVARAAAELRRAERLRRRSAASRTVGWRGP